MIVQASFKHQLSVCVSADRLLNCMLNLLCLPISPRMVQCGLRQRGGHGERYPQTDGQTAQAKRTIKQTLRPQHNAQLPAALPTLQKLRRHLALVLQMGRAQRFIGTVPRGSP